MILGFWEFILGLRDDPWWLRLAVVAALDYAWQISETSAFQQTLAVESGNENTYTESVTSLSASLVGNLALVASYTIKNNSEVPVGTEETDKFTAISLEYTF